MAGGDQQFCLRWNNHQTTLTSIFGTLLDAEELFDCTLSAEGRCVRAHRILLSACSPYFQFILSQHPDGNPIFILKDVKYKELRALMDYMYKGEVNVSQDELGELLKVAESLKIKGLSDSAEKTEERPVQQRLAAPPPPPAQPTPNVARTGLTIEHRRSNYQSNDLHVDHPSTSAESPGPRKRKRVRRRSSDDESGSGMSQIPIEPLNSSFNDASSPVVQPMPRLQVTQTASSKTTAVIPQTTLERPLIPEPASHPVIVPKTEPPIEQVLVPKQEVDDLADESADYEDLTLDDDMLDDSQPGPSHGSEGSSSQGFPPWQMNADGTMDEDMMRAQEAAGGTRDAQGTDISWILGCSSNLQSVGAGDQLRYQCQRCGRSYKHRKHLTSHLKFVCGKEPQFQCNFCTYRSKQKYSLNTHLKMVHCGLLGKADSQMSPH